MSRARLAALALALAAAVVAAPAAADPAAEAVRDKVRAAVGYDAFRRLEHGVVLAGPAEAHGVPGTLTLRLHPDGRYAEATDTVGWSTGFDGKTRWTRMFTNPAFPAELVEGDRFWLEYQILAHRWLAPDGGFTVEPDPAEHRTYRPCLVVRHPAARGAAARVYVDPTTWLPTRFSTIAVGQEAVIELSDWKDVGGVKVPARMEKSRYSGGPTFAAAAVAAAPPPAPGTDPFAPPPPPADTAFDPAAAPAVEARVAKGVLFVRPAVNGKPGPWFQLSTKSPASGMLAAVADRYALPAFGKAKANGPEGATVMRYRSAERLGLGTAAIGGLVMLELPPGMADIGKLTGVEDFGGVLGADVLARVVLEADIRGGTAAVHDPRTYRPPPGLAWEPVRFDRETPYLTATFEGRHTGLFAFGTEGAEEALWFAPGAVRGLNLLAGRETEPFGMGNELYGYQAAGCEFRAFGRAVRPAVTQFVTNAWKPDKYPASLGAFTPTTLGPGTVVFDYPNRRIGFAPKP